MRRSWLRQPNRLRFTLMPDSVSGVDGAKVSSTGGARETERESMRVRLDGADDWLIIFVRLMRDTRPRQLLTSSTFICNLI